MAKQVCESCKATVGLFQQIKMKDGNYICRKCMDKTHPYFAPAEERTFSMYQEHLKQLENGKLLYEKLFIPRKKPADKSMKLKKFGGGCIEVANDIGLIALVAKRGGFLFWGGENYYMVFRMGDLYKYDYSCTLTGGTDRQGKSNKRHFINLAFWDTDGCDECKVEMLHDSSVVEAVKYFDDCFGLKRDYKAMVSVWKNQIGDLKKAFQRVKTSFSGKVDEVEDSARQLTQAERFQLYGDRTQWIAMADAAIKSVLG